MADKTIDQLTELTTLEANDLLIAYDVSELGTEKIRKITKTNAFAGVGGGVTTKIGTLTRIMSAVNEDVAQTGLGFTPSAIIFAGVARGGQEATTMFCTLSSMQGITRTTSWYATNNLEIYPVAGGRCNAVLKSFDADGFTLTWSKTGSPTGFFDVIYLAFR